MPGVNIYGELHRAQLEYLTSDPTAGVTARVIWNSTTGVPKIDNGTNFYIIQTTIPYAFASLPSAGNLGRIVADSTNSQPIFDDGTNQQIMPVNNSAQLVLAARIFGGG